MKKNLLILGIAVISILICNPAMGQSVKKLQKQAEKQKIIEDMKMKSTLDSLERVRALKAAQNQEVVISTPCGTDKIGMLESGVIRSKESVGESMDQEMATKLAYTAALASLASKINTSVENLTHQYGGQNDVNKKEHFERVTKDFIENIVKEKVSGYTTACEKMTKLDNDNYKCYVVIEINKDEVLKPVHQTLSKEGILKSEFDYQQFKKEFDKTMKEYKEENQQ